MNRGIPLIVLLVIGLSTVAGCLGNSPTASTNTNPITAKSEDWCKAGSKYTSSSPSGSASTEVIGITDFKGHTVCQIDIKTDQYTITTYNNQDGTYSYQIMKDEEGNVLNEGEQTAPK